MYNYHILSEAAVQYVYESRHAYTHTRIQIQMYVSVCFCFCVLNA